MKQNQFTYGLMIPQQKNPNHPSRDRDT